MTNNEYPYPNWDTDVLDQEQEQESSWRANLDIIEQGDPRYVRLMELTEHIVGNTVELELPSKTSEE